MAVIRLLVCGGRTYADANRLNAILDAVHRKHAIEVLREPTEVMEHRGCLVNTEAGGGGLSRYEAGEVWRAMIDAALDETP